MGQTKTELLSTEVRHLDITQFDFVTLIESMQGTAFQARNLARAAQIYHQMLADKQCGVILCLAGSLISAGLKKIILDMIENNMVDVIVSTGANIVDQDFFEGLGFKHYQGSPRLEDTELQALAIDRIYDTLINEDELRICDDTIKVIADSLEPRPYSSREFIAEMGRYLEKHAKNKDSIVLRAYQKNIPIFVPAFSDCSAGFGLVMHQVAHPQKHVSIDSVKDFRELTELKIKAKETGLLMIGGGVPKNFAQDIVVAAELLGAEVPLHKYAVQITVADERDGALSGSTLREACSWGKVSVVHEQMVFCEATIAMPLVVGYAYGKGAWRTRENRAYSKLFAETAETVS
ncbi:1,9-bis(guanidino)-5-aza-nonane synthase [Aquicella lusitana]|uniref:Deoxyhypusine synthase-like protein n=1 Tax=Aquicella lusitana TaxID=254246 RepID=A0A370GC20_9COXI|nr:deoxyhypusine synthase [Aquicella lusitana]RDI41328.1 homospermidine synthase (spermidine-specific) [Aquicella lusitana]VVC72306.1 Deoxyhypusine synthase-like protein [Aquicella lusitana]